MHRSLFLPLLCSFALLNSFGSSAQAQPELVTDPTTQSPRSLWRIDVNSAPVQIGVLGDDSQDLGVLVDFVQQPRGIWRVDGATAYELSPEPWDVHAFYRYNGLLYYTGIGGHSGGLWSSDGTGVDQIFDDVYQGQAFLDFDSVASQQLLFAGAHPDQELWSTDGTTAGTGELADIAPGSSGGFNPGPDSSLPRELTRLGDLALFTAIRPKLEDSRVLYRTDGTTLGTEAVQNLDSPGLLSEVSELTVLEDRILMVAQHPGTGLELAVTDGTAEGTRILFDILPGAESSEPYLLRRLGERIFFFTRQRQGEDPNVPPRFGSTLWSTDGQEDLDVVSQLVIDGQRGHVLEAVVVGDRMYFVAGNRATGPELWVTDGTTKGTRLVRDLRRGPRGSHPRSLTAVGDLVVFSADDGRRGRELWSSDGRRMWLVTDLAPGSESSTPELITVTADHLYFSADDGVQGRALWVMDRTDVTPGVGVRQQRSP